MVLFAASGNSPTSEVGYPGIYRSVNAVGGIFCDGQSYGTTGNALFLVGPAADVYTTALGGGFDVSGGTSLSSPFAAGVAALVLSANPSLSPAGVELAMIVSARDLGVDGFDSRFGHGLLRADEAIIAGGEIAQGAAVVDASLGGSPGAAPYDVQLHPSVAAGISAVPDHGAVLVRGGLPYDEVLVIDKPLVMRAWDGEAVIGE
jgi:subtilisin family serine protease